MMANQDDLLRRGTFRLQRARDIAAERAGERPIEDPYGEHVLRKAAGETDDAQGGARVTALPAEKKNHHVDRRSPP